MPEADPWGNRYLVNIGARGYDSPLTLTLSPLRVERESERSSAVWVLSAGPNGIIETPFSAPASSAVLGGDDIGALVR